MGMNSRNCAVKDISGMRFGKLVVVAPTWIGRSAWECVCDCGSVRVVRHNNLVSGNTTSCGCSRIGKMKPPRRPRSAFLDMPEYAVWKGINQRCKNPRYPRYSMYGGRGIKVCERWASFNNFIADMGSRPTPKHQIDRINNNGPYAPENCRWTDAKTNSRNRRDNLVLVLGNEARPICEWSEITGIHWGTIWSRIYKHGWPVDRALTEPTQTNKRNTRAKT